MKPVAVISNDDLSRLPTGFTVSYDGNTYSLEGTTQGEIESSLFVTFGEKGLPTDTHIVLTAPNGDAIKVGPDTQPDPRDAASLMDSWITDELKQFVGNPARQQSRVPVTA